MPLTAPTRVGAALARTAAGTVLAAPDRRFMAVARTAAPVAAPSHHAAPATAPSHRPGMPRRAA
ncbi:hypothetical protein AB0C96_31330 [Streptomyces sp. NPDC048506]|uniref:hypothetical protein n=1 Tax=Streptomyces sp. NPDC048506 TaxID=3155028 RepID=UPI003445672D